MNQRRTKIISATLIGVLLAFQNCAKFEFGYADMKTGVLSNSSVLGDRVPVTTEPTDPKDPRPTGTEGTDPRNPGTEGTDPKTPTTPTTPTTPVTPTPPNVPDTSAAFGLPYYCGSLMAHWTGYTLRTVNEPVKVVFLKDQPFQDLMAQNGQHDMSREPDSPLSDLKAECELQDDLFLSELREHKVLTIRNLAKKCPGLAPGSYMLNVVRASQTRNYQRGLLIGAGGATGFSAKTYAAQWNNQRYSYIDFIEAQSRVLANVTRNGAVLDVTISSSGPFFPEILNDIAIPHGGINCDTSYSPLVVQFGNQPIKLTSPEQGVRFDIQGLLATPIAHAKYLISWLQPAPNLGSYFIVLPNQKGQVNGIDELFGNNTAGPDARNHFAINGYEALRKWDGRRANGTFDGKARDGFITAADPVFAKLRYWRDSNGNGVAEPSELFTPTEMKVQSIDLDADGRFPEVDKYGNVVTLKSLLKTTDGVQHVMYDVYFAGAE